ncbi:MAG: hypothetical protein R3Y43_03185 [Alphaproteobacteria bacterium]
MAKDKTVARKQTVEEFLSNLSAKISAGQLTKSEMAILKKGEFTLNNTVYKFPDSVLNMYSGKYNEGAKDKTVLADEKSPAKAEMDIHGNAILSEEKESLTDEKKEKIAEVVGSVLSAKEKAEEKAYQEEQALFNKFLEENNFGTEGKETAREEFERLFNDHVEHGTDQSVGAFYKKEFEDWKAKQKDEVAKEEPTKETTEVDDSWYEEELQEELQDAARGYTDFEPVVTVKEDAPETGIQRTPETGIQRTPETGIQRTPKTGIQRTPKDEGLQVEEQVAESVLHRVRSKTSDENAVIFNTAVVYTLRTMDVVSDTEMQAASGNLERQQELASRVDDLSTSQKVEFDTKFAQGIANNEQLLVITPPRVLADSCQSLKAIITGKDVQDPEVKANQEALNKITGRMDELSDNMAAHQEEFFADFTNTADIYDGYNYMFDAREKELDANVKEDAAKLNTIKGNRETLDGLMSDYDDVWNLKDITENDAAVVDKTFDDNNKALEGMMPSQEVMDALKNYHFLDEKGQKEEQFDDKGELIKGGKLDRVIELAKSDVVFKSLGGKTQLDNETLQDNLELELASKLHTIHNSEELIKDATSEHPKKFTDQKHLREFIGKLTNVERPMTISHNGFNTAMDYQVNAVDGLANRMNQKLGRGTPVIGKMYNKVADIDKMAATRQDGYTTKRQARIKQLKSVGSKLAISAVTAAGISLASAYTVAHTSVSGLAVGAVAVGAGLTMTAINIMKKRKEAKKAGKKYGLKEFFQDKQMLGTVATTTLGAAALGFAATGNPGAAAICGYGAMGVGAVTGGASSYAQAKKDGLSTWESVMWGAANAGAVIGGAMAGRAGAQAFMEGNEAFMTKEEIAARTETRTETHVEYKEGVVQDTENFLKEHRFSSNPEKLDYMMKEVEAYNAAHPDQPPLEPARVINEWSNAGGITPDNQTLHVQGGADVQSNGFNKLYGAGYAADRGLETGDIKALANMFDANGNFTPSQQGIDTFRVTDMFTSGHNQVGHVAGTIGQNDGVLGFNSEMGPDGVARSTIGQDGMNPDGFRTYADHGGSMHTVTTTHDVVVSDAQTIHHQAPDAPGIFGWATSNFKKTKERVGSLLDKIRGKGKVLPPVDGPKVLPEHKVPKQLPAHEEPKVLPEHKVPKQLPAHKEEKADLLMEEYKIVYGHEPSDKSEATKKHYDNYATRVEAERQSEAPSVDMDKYLLKRKIEFNKKLTSAGMSTKPEERKEGINQARQSLNESNISRTNMNNTITLTHFGDYATMTTSNDDRGKVIKGSRRPDLNPDMSKYKENSTVEIYDINQYLFEGKTKPCDTAKGKDDIMTKLKNVWKNITRQEEGTQNTTKALRQQQGR